MSERDEKRGSVRVAAAQFATGVDVEENLRSCLRVIDEAARGKADLVVLPEFSNHLSWYEDKAHCYRVSLPLGGAFLSAIAERAKKHGMHVALNCTVQREGGTATCTSLLFGPTGELLGSSDKQVLMGHENDFLERGARIAPILETSLGRIGLYACMDGVVCEPTRSLGVRGAQILCNSLNSFAPDEAALHIPVRAAENRVFVVAANKVGPLIPEALIDAASAATNIPKQFLSGAGESQIVAPDGSVLAKAPKTGEAVVFADIVVAQADDKRRRDGTDVLAARRPDSYRPIAEAPLVEPGSTFAPAVERAEVAVIRTQAEGVGAIEEACTQLAAAAAAGVSLVVLPELFCFSRAVIDDAAAAAKRSSVAATALARTLDGLGEAGRRCHVVTSLVEETGPQRGHVGVVIGASGIVGRQPQLHRPARHASWATAPLGSEIAPVDLGWARLGVVVGEDAIFPETFRLLALRGIEVAAVPFHALEAWETKLGLLERSAENRVCVVAATRMTTAGTSLVTTLHHDFTLMTPWKDRAFDGLITAPIVTRAAPEPGVLRATIHPANAHNKVVSHRTHLVDGRPWNLAGPLVAERPL